MDVSCGERVVLGYCQRIASMPVDEWGEYILLISEEGEWRKHSVVEDGWRP